jgi:hypothetical protein
MNPEIADCRFQIADSFQIADIQIARSQIGDFNESEINGQIRNKSEFCNQSAICNLQSEISLMHLYVEPMDALVVEVSDDGRVRLENEQEFSTPGLQERRAILYAAKNEVEELTELIEKLQDGEIAELQKGPS